MLDLVAKKYPMYAWSLRTLSRRLSYFEIKYINHHVQLDDLRQAVQKEVEGPVGYLATGPCIKKFARYII